MFATEIVDGRKVYQLVGIIHGGEHHPQSSDKPNGWVDGKYSRKFHKKYLSKFDQMIYEVGPLILANP